MDAGWRGLCPSTSAPISLPVLVGAGWASEDLEVACTDLVELSIDLNVEDDEAPPTPTAGDSSGSTKSVGLDLFY